MDLRRALDDARTAALAAADVVLPLFCRPGLRIDHKGDGSPVTEADLRAEERIRAVLALRTPSIPVLGEEQGGEVLGSEFHWVVDPIDGTQSFSRGIPLFGTLIGLRETATGAALIGVIHLAALGRTYAGGPTLGATCDGEPISVRGPGHRRTLAESVLSSGDPRQYAAAGVPEDFSRVAALSAFFRGYADCFGHALAASGAVGVMVDPALAPWDLVASEAVLAGAGGAVWTRPSRDPGKLDAVLGDPPLVAACVAALAWTR